MSRFVNLTAYGRLVISLAVLLACFGLWATLSAYSSGPIMLPAPGAAMLPYSVPTSVTAVTPQAQTTILSALADARVKDSSASSNYGTDPELRARLSSSSSNYESYLKFDLTSLGSVSSAKLR